MKIKLEETGGGSWKIPFSEITGEGIISPEVEATMPLERFVPSTVLIAAPSVSIRASTEQAQHYGFVAPLVIGMAKSELTIQESTKAALHHSYAMQASPMGTPPTTIRDAIIRSRPKEVKEILMRKLDEIKKSIDSGIFNEELRHVLLAIREFAKRYPHLDLDTVVHSVVQELWEKLPLTTVKLKENRLVKFDENLFAIKEKDGTISIFRSR